MYYNTPFTDFQNTIHFESNSERDKFFDENYKRIDYDYQNGFNFIRDRLILRCSIPTEDVYGINYMRFQNSFDKNLWYYCYVVGSEYINDKVTQFFLVIDVVMTFLQGDFTQYLNNMYVSRQHLTKEQFNKNARWLMTNDDVLQFPKQYRRQEVEKWQDFQVIFTTSVDLTVDFGSENDPKMKTSSGQTYDGICSPVDLYLCDSTDDFIKLCKILSKYPWISQNINNVSLVPKDIVDQSDLKQVDNANNELAKVQFFKFKNGGKTKSVKLKTLSYSPEVIKQAFDYDNDMPEYLMREDYSTIELNSWDGQHLSVDYTFLPSEGLSLYAQAIFGYHNEIRVIIDKYKSSGENSVSGLYRGTYANHAIIFNVFDDIPVLVDNYKLAKANSAHERELSNQRTISGRINEITNSNDSVKDKFMNALSIMSDVSSGGFKKVGGMFVDEYEHYRTQKAQLEDKAITAPSVGSQNNSQSFNISANIFGVTAKYSSIGKGYAKKVMRYHGIFGFDFQDQVNDVYPIDTMPIMNFLKCSGNITIPNIPSQYIQQLQALLENGIKFWKNKGIPNPFNQDLLNNQM